MKYQAYTGEVTMRADNHQIIAADVYLGFRQGWHARRQVRLGAHRLRFSHQGPGRGADTMMPTTCKMQRPRETLIKTLRPSANSRGEATMDAV
jgi:hypothetical protein